jgi:CubicO group peptidase (beta-lactamase class C family)
VFAATGTFYQQEVERRILKPLGMNDASLGLEGIEASPRWAKPHVRGRGGWVSLQPKPTYYRVAPAAGVNASISDMAQWMLAHGGHRPDVLPAPLLATLHAPLVATPGEMRGSWRRQRLSSASYAIGWRVYDYAGHQVGLPRRCGAGLSRHDGDAARARPRRRDPLEQRELAAFGFAADDPRQRDRVCRRSAGSMSRRSMKGCMRSRGRRRKRGSMRRLRLRRRAEAKSGNGE